MANKPEENLDDDIVIEMTDEDGNTFYYVEEMVIPVEGENFALLVEVKDEDHEHGCDCGCEDDDVIIAKIIVNANGQEEYIEPTDEEFERVQAVYEQLLYDEYE